LGAPRATGAAESARVEPRASAALASWALGASLAGFLCLPLVGGLIGLGVGWMARSELREHARDAPGRGRALAAILLGAANVLATLVVAGVALARLTPAPAAPAGPMPVWPPPAPPGPAPPPVAAADGGLPAHAGAARDAAADAGPKTKRIGEITLVDVSRTTRSLRDELEAERRGARERKQTLLLWIVAPECPPCDGVRASLPDARMQRALDRVHIVEIDIAERAPELVRLGVPIDTIPGFALPGSDLGPGDYVHGGEWDEDVPGNIAPVLGAFVRGKYAHRRHPWRRPLRDGETTL
jgi:hypothetical protein